MSKVLYIDLTNQAHEVREREDLFDEYIGGVGVATQLLLEECPEGADPLGPDNPVIFAIGPLNGLFPSVSKTVAMFKSPLTGELGESYAGGRLHMAMKFAGYDAIVIQGKAEEPVYLSLHGDDVQVKDASSIWGITSVPAIGRILRENEPGVGKRSIVRIGKAGENQVRYACANVDTYRHFGRLGLGAVMGAKNLKALVVSGAEEYTVPDMDEYQEVYQELYRRITETGAMAKYHDLGTPANINVLNQLKGLPTRNFQQSSFEYAESLSGEHLADNYLTRKIACAHCPIGCIHIAQTRTAFAEGHEYEIRNVSYDYELIYALGTMLGMAHPIDMLHIIEHIEDYGLDAMSTGVALAWATEAYQEDLISDDETIEPIRWNDKDAYKKAIDRIVEQPNDFYQALAQGVRVASEKYGGEDYAMELGKNEVAGYHTGPASIIGQLVGARHSHLDNGGYSVDQKAAKGMTEEEMVDSLIKEDNGRNIANSLIMCLFARGVYDEEMISRALHTVGIEKTVDELTEVGQKVFDAKYEFKQREGYKLEDQRIPRRFYETVSQLGWVTEDQIKRMLKLYKQKRGWPTKPSNPGKAGESKTAGI